MLDDVKNSGERSILSNCSIMEELNIVNHCKINAETTLETKCENARYLVCGTKQGLEKMRLTIVLKVLYSKTAYYHYLKDPFRQNHIIILEMESHNFLHFW